MSCRGRCSQRRCLFWERLDLSGVRLLTDDYDPVDTLVFDVATVGE